MKKIFLPVLISACLFFAAEALAQKDTPPPDPAAAGETREIPPPLEEPAFRLEDLPDDSGEMRLFKAALRLYKGYNVAVMRLNACQPQHPAADKAMQSYVRLNGNTMRLVLSIVKQSGGMTLDQKNVLDDLIAKELSKSEAFCPQFIKDLEKGLYDLHKAPRFSRDYKAIRAK